MLITLVNYLTGNNNGLLKAEMSEFFSRNESESEYYSEIRNFSNPNPNIIGDLKNNLNIFESLKRFEYLNVIKYYLHMPQKKICTNAQLATMSKGRYQARSHLKQSFW